MVKEHSLNRRCIAEGVCLLLFLSVITFVFLTKSPLHIWVGSDTGTDSSVFMTIAMMMDKGYMPYRDTFDHKGPLLYLINYLGRQISVYRGVWVIEFVSLFAAFLLVYKIARLRCGKVLSCIVLLVSVSLLFTFFNDGNLVEEYAMPFIAGALFIFLDFFLNHKITKIRLIFCGMCLGGVCLLRVNMISVWVVFCIAVLIKIIASRSFHDLQVFTIFFVLGFLILVLPIILWLVINNSFIDFWDAYIRFNFMYSDSGTPARWRSFFSFYNQPAVTIASITLVYMLYEAENRFLYGTYCCYLLLTLVFIGISGRVYPHYGMILVPAAAFPIAVLFDICTGKLSSNRVNTGAFLISLYFLYTMIMPDWLPIIYDLSTKYDMRKEEKNSGLVNEVCRIISDNTQYDDKISVYGNWDIIYVLSDREHASRYSYQFPISYTMPAIMQDYFNELQEQLPLIIVIQSGYYNGEIADFLDANGYSLIWSESGDMAQSALVYLYSFK